MLVTVVLLVYYGGFHFSFFHITVQQQKFLFVRVTLLGHPNYNMTQYLCCEKEWHKSWICVELVYLLRPHTLYSLIQLHSLGTSVRGLAFFLYYHCVNRLELNWNSGTFLDTSCCLWQGVDWVMRKLQQDFHWKSQEYMFMPTMSYCMLIVIFLGKIYKSIALIKLTWPPHKVCTRAKNEQFHKLRRVLYLLWEALSSDPARKQIQTKSHPNTSEKLYKRLNTTARSSLGTFLFLILLLMYVFWNPSASVPGHTDDDDVWHKCEH